MGITVAYRGRLADLTRIEDFEDRLLDLALDLGGLAQIWRSHADDDPKRMVRGIVLNLAPGLEATSLLVSPEGWLIGLTDIEDAELGRLTEPPWCFTRTHFAALEAHVTVVETLTALRREFLPDLEVSDEGGYWETRDLAELARRRAQVQGAIEGLAEGLRRHGLSREAAEDPELLRRHIERLAAQVHRLLGRPAEHPPVTFPEGDIPDPEASEALWDEMFKHNRRQQERMQRALEERRGGGEDDEEAFRHALDDLALDDPDDDEASDESWPDDDGALEQEAGFGTADEAEEPFAGEATKRHPLLQNSTDLLMQVQRSLREVDPRFASALNTLNEGIVNVVGGLAQALRDHGDPDDDRGLDGLNLAQLKRALRGAAFARGALFPLRPVLGAERFDAWLRTLEQLEQEIFREIGRVRSEHRE